MHGRLRALDSEALDDLPDACRRCTFWETHGGARGPSQGGAVRAGKEAWWRAAQLEWGTPGKALYHEDALIAYALFAPARHVARARTLRPPASEDALLLATLWVAEDHRRAGQARTLLQGVLREAAKRHLRAVEAYGVRGGAEPWRCVVPAAFLESSGFSLHQDDHHTPLYRLPLRSLLTWHDPVVRGARSVLDWIGARERAPTRRPA